MTPAAPRIVNDVSYATAINRETLGTLVLRALQMSFVVQEVVLE